MRAPLHLATAADRPPTPAERIASLHAEAKALAVELTADMGRQLAQVAATAAEVVAGGEAFGPGVQALARDIILTAERQGFQLQAITARSAP